MIELRENYDTTNMTIGDLKDKVEDIIHYWFPKFYTDTVLEDYLGVSMFCDIYAPQSHSRLRVASLEIYLNVDPEFEEDLVTFSSAVPEEMKLSMYDAFLYKELSSGQWKRYAEKVVSGDVNTILKSVDDYFGKMYKDLRKFLRRGALGHNLETCLGDSL